MNYEPIPPAPNLLLAGLLACGMCFGVLCLMLAYFSVLSH